MSKKKNYSDREFVKKYNELSDSNLNIIWIIIVIFSLFLIVKVYPDLFPGTNTMLTMGLITEFFVIIFCVLMSNKVKKNKFMKEFGMDESRALRRYNYIHANPILPRDLALVKKICLLNPGARSLQEEHIRGWYVVNYVENPDLLYYEDAVIAMTFAKYSSDYNEVNSSLSLLSSSLSRRQMFVEKLFKLSILEDGIHNDEWNALMEIMRTLNLNRNYIEYFKKRYDPLRTEFEEGDPRNFTASREIPGSMLKHYYRVLGLDENATDDEIKRAYHNLALQYHPDLLKNADRKDECEAMMAKINEAYAKISA